jgi:hypothetical protein
MADRKIPDFDRAELDFEKAAFMPMDFNQWDLASVLAPD